MARGFLVKRYDSIKDIFNLLLDWHLRRGTRPSGSPSPEKPEKTDWMRKVFAADCNVAPKTVSNWCSGNTLPDKADFEVIVTTLIGEEPAQGGRDKFVHFRTDLRAAYATAMPRTIYQSDRTANGSAEQRGFGVGQAFEARTNAFQDEYLKSGTGPVPFGGRNRELRQLDEWLFDKTAPPRLLMAAPAGRGKSALLVRWVRSLSESRLR